MITSQTLPHCSDLTQKAGAASEPSLPGRIRPVTNWLNYSGGFPPSYENHKEMLMRE